MKKMKISVIAITVLLLGVIGSAFTIMNPPKPTTLTWYKLGVSADPSIAGNYVKFSTDPGCPEPVNDVCAIQVTDNGTHPTQTDVDNLMNQTNDFTEENPAVQYRP